MPRLATPDKLLNQIHYSITPTLGTSTTKSKNRWSKVYQQGLQFHYEITEQEMLENDTDQHAVFHSGPKWAVIDEELRNLKIRPGEHLIIQFSLVATESPTIPLFMQIMAYPTMEAVAASLLFAGLLALTTALIALIPPVASALAVISISSATIAIAGFILSVVGAISLPATKFCQKELDKDPFRPEKIDLIVEQLGFPESRKSVTQDTKEKLLPQFFSPAKVQKPSVIVEEVMDDEESETGLGL